MARRATAVIVTALALGGLPGCESQDAVRSSPAPRAAEPARPAGMAELRAGELPAWWIAEPKAARDVVSVSAAGTAADLGVARDIAVRNARAAGRAVLGLEPVRVVVSREAFSRARTGEYEAYVLARCDGAGAAALPIGGERAGAAPKAGAPATGAPAAGPTATAAPVTPAKPTPEADKDPSRLPTWWIEDIKREGAMLKACAKADGTELGATRRAAVEAAKARLTSAGVTGTVQTLFISTKRLDGGGYRVYVLGQGEAGEGAPK